MNFENAFYIYTPDGVLSEVTQFWPRTAHIIPLWDLPALESKPFYEPFEISQQNISSRMPPCRGRGRRAFVTLFDIAEATAREGEGW